MIAELGCWGLVIVAFTVGVFSGWLFTMGAVVFAVRILMFAVSDRRENGNG